MRITIYSLLCLFAFSGLGARAQNSVRGYVSDAQTNEPLSQAFIFLPDVQQGVLTSEGGRFQLQRVQGRLLMQVTHVGYENYFITLSLPADSVITVSLKPSTIPMKEVVITGSMLQSPLETSFNTTQISKAEMNANGALSVSDGLARLPGASQLTTGAGISKPVIRGLYGNRIQVNVNGLRFDNQQWQDEHGLGLSNMGIDRVEIIKGPSSLLYGSDAMGGVLNIIDEKPAAVGTIERNLNAQLFSNTFGVAVNYGVRKSVGERWKKFRVGFDNHSDYSDGNNNRVLNSRFATYNLKSSWGKNKSNGVRIWNLAASFSEFGFVFDSAARKSVDGRLSRSFDGAHHLVGFVQANTENVYYKSRGKVKLNAGFTSNLRMEDEGGGGISLSMLLNTLNVIGQRTMVVGTNDEWTYGASMMFQTNTNFGGRIIIPDAITGEGSVFTFYKHVTNRWLMEGGLRFDEKFIGTFATASLNVVGNGSPTEEIVPFNASYQAFNASAGLAYRISDDLRIKANASTGYRPGNLAELSSNGLHEGTLRWEIGLSDAAIEQNLNVETSLEYNRPYVIASVSAYHNSFKNYFYLAPTGQEYFGFNVYHYRQSDATLQGGELAVEVSPAGSPVGIGGSYSVISAKKSDGSYLPFIPANKLTGDLKLKLKGGADITDPSFRVGVTYAFDQSRPAEFETGTPSYLLLQASASAVYKKVNLLLACTNLLNRQYYDHLSRFKYYGIGNMGRNIVLTMNFKI